MDPKLPGIARSSDALALELTAALERRGPGYIPRTHHLDEAGKPLYTNRLIRESSPYLLQHAHNPVNWFPWSEEAFARAHREDRLVVLSVGYSTCHWCHVMERESFEDEEIAAFLNSHFIAVKVDREERPDVDAVYMTTVQMMTGHGGWPMTVIITPEKKPIFGGTYFPPRDGDRGAEIGFLSLLRQIESARKSAGAELAEQAETLTNRLIELSARDAASEVPSAFAVRDTAVHYALRFDPQWGGFGAAPKFPRSAILELLSRYARRTKDTQAKHMVETTLEKMAWGGMYDQIAGGFHRYSVDGFWLVPHFEKMLYDNAQLAASYAEGAVLCRRDDFAVVASEICDYVLREMTHPDGGFYSATDADSMTPNGELEEGWYFTWTVGELEAALDSDAMRVVRARYAISDAGNFEGRNVLNRRRSDDDVARELGFSPEEMLDTLHAIHSRLRNVRSTRPAPLRDEKIIAGWNGLMISGFARCGRYLRAPRFIHAAERAAEFVFSELWDGEALTRSWCDGTRSTSGYLDDYAFFVRACLDLVDTHGTGSADAARKAGLWLARARALQAVLDRDFWDEARGGYWYIGAQQERLLVREKPGQDGAEPGGNSVAALNLVRLAALTDERSYREKATRTFAAFGETLDYAGPAVPMMLCALESALDDFKQVVVVEGEGGEVLRTVLCESFAPNAIIVAPDTPGVPWSAGKASISGKASIHVCIEGACALPVTDPDVLRKTLADAKPLFAERVPELRLKR